MKDESKAAEAELHLREVWETLVRERQRALARCVEGVLAEISDTSRNATDRLGHAAREWNALLKNPRGLTDFGIWRENQAERLHLNSEFERHLKAVQRLLR